MAWGGLTAEYYGLTAEYYCTSILVQAEAGLVMKAGGYGRKWDVLLALVGNVCRWPTMTIRELTMAAADSTLAADPLFHLGPGGHVGRVAVRYWYFRPELKYLTCQACAEGDGRSVVELEEVACQHRIPTS
jgi:hypothetical protein